MSWGRQKAIASWQRCRNHKTCCLCVALPLQPEGCSGRTGLRGEPRAPGPAVPSARPRAPQPREDFRPRGERKPRPLPTGGKKAPGARSAGGCSALRVLGVGTGMLPGAPRRSQQPSVFTGAPRRAAAAPRRRLRHRPEHPRCPSAAAAAGDSPRSETPAPPAGWGLNPQRLCPALAGDKHALNNGHVCSNMISPNNAE